MFGWVPGIQSREVIRNIIEGLVVIGLLLLEIWMLAQDYDRPLVNPKRFQTLFRKSTGDDKNR